MSESHGCVSLPENSMSCRTVVLLSKLAGEPGRLAAAQAYRAWDSVLPAPARLAGSCPLLTARRQPDRLAGWQTDRRTSRETSYLAQPRCWSGHPVYRLEGGGGRRWMAGQCAVAAGHSCRRSCCCRHCSTAVGCVRSLLARQSARRGDAGSSLSGRRRAASSAAVQLMTFPQKKGVLDADISA